MECFVLNPVSDGDIFVVAKDSYGMEQLLNTSVVTKGRRPPALRAIMSAKTFTDYKIAIRQKEDITVDGTTRPLMTFSFRWDMHTLYYVLGFALELLAIFPNSYRHPISQVNCAQLEANQRYYCHKEEDSSTTRKCWTSWNIIGHVRTVTVYLPLTLQPSSCCIESQDINVSLVAVNRKKVTRADLGSVRKEL